MKFEVGKFYEHSGGGQIYICGGPIWTFGYGIGLVAEHPKEIYSIVGIDEANALNWHEISKEKYLKNFKE